MPAIAAVVKSFDASAESPPVLVPLANDAQKLVLDVLRVLQSAWEDRGEIRVRLQPLFPLSRLWTLTYSQLQFLKAIVYRQTSTRKTWPFRVFHQS
jgi:hypothetical protein